jgi:hypothetical protein
MGSSTLPTIVGPGMADEPAVGSPVRSKAQELREEHQPADAQSVIADDHRTHQVEHQFPCHSTEVPKDAFEAGEQGLHVLGRIDAGPMIVIDGATVTVGGSL